MKDDFKKSELECIDVDTGEVKVASKAVVLRAMAIGSCVVMVAVDGGKKIGGLAHIMLPGRSLKKDNNDKTKYAEDAIDELLEKLKNLGAKIEDLEVYLFGGADLVGDSYICELIVESVLNYLERLNVFIKHKNLRGIQRRSVSLDMNSGEIFYTEGDDKAGKMFVDDFCFHTDDKLGG